MHTYAVPAAGDRDRLGVEHGISGLGGPEVRPCLCGVLVAAGVAQSKRVVEEGRLAVVHRARGCVVAVACFQEGDDVGDL